MTNKTIHSINSLSDLRNYVYQTLCNDHELLMDAFPTSESILKRGKSESCGVMFCLHGPRAVKYSAIWEKDKGRILFYGPSGKRYHQVELSKIVIDI